MNLKSFKRISITLISVMMFFALLLGFVAVLQTKNKTAFAETEDFTKLTTEEQNEIDKKILEEWGNPSSSQLKKLENNATELDLSGDAWYYLTEDITVNIANLNSSNFNLRILMNGYSISGNFRIDDFSESTVSIFDKIPNKTASDGEQYKYNSSAVRYYSYNSTKKIYSTYSSTKPTGTDVTANPTFQENTYIKVQGSALSPNAKNDDAKPVLFFRSNSSLNVFGINLIGNSLPTSGSLLNLLGGIGGTLNLFQSTIIGNNGYWPPIYLDNGSTANLVGNKIYGNKAQVGRDMPEVAIGRLGDIMTRAGSTGDPNQDKNNVNVFKNNIGVLMFYTYYADSTHSVDMKDVIFGELIQGLKPSNFAEKVQNMNNISGNLSIRAGINMVYNGNSPNLSFNVEEGATLRVTGTVKHITINGGSIYMEGTIDNLTFNKGIIIVASSNASLLTGTTLTEGNGIVINEGVKLAANITLSGGSLELKANSTLNGSVTNNSGTFTIGQGATVTGMITNNATINIREAVSNLTVAGDGYIHIWNTVDNLTVNGNNKIDVRSDGTLTNLTYNGNSTEEKVTVWSNGTFTVEENKTLNCQVKVDGTINIAGKVMSIFGVGRANIQPTGNLTIDRSFWGNVMNNGGTVNVKASLDNLSGNGTLNILTGGTATLNNSYSGKITNNGTLITRTALTGLKVFGSGEILIYNSMDNLTVDPNAKLSVRDKGTLRNLSYSRAGGGSGQIVVWGGGNFIIEPGKTIEADTKVDGTISVYGTIKNLWGYGSATIEASGTATIVSGKSMSTLTNKGKLNLIGGVSNLTNTGTLNIVEGTNYTVGNNVNLGGSVVNNGKLTVVGTANSVTNAGGTITVNGTINTLTARTGTVSIAGTVNTLNFNGGELIVTSTDANLPNSITIPKDGTLTVNNNITVSSTIHNNGGRLNANGTINTLTSNAGTVHVIGTINALTFNGGDIIVIGANANLPNTITIPNGGSLTVNSNVTLHATVVNNGTLDVKGSIVKVTRDNATETVSNSGLLNVAGSIDSIKNTSKGSVNLNSGAKVSSITSNGNLVVNGGANVESMVVNGGKAIVKASAAISNVTVNAGAELELNPTVKPDTIVNNGGSIVEPAIPVKSNTTAILIITFSAVGGALLLASLMFVIIFFSVKARNKKHYEIAKNCMKERLAKNPFISKNRWRV